MLTQDWVLLNNVSLVFGCLSGLGVGFMAALGSWLTGLMAVMACGSFLIYGLSRRKINEVG